MKNQACISEGDLKRRIIDAVGRINTCIPLASGVQSFTEGMMNPCRSVNDLQTTMDGQIARALCYLIAAIGDNDTVKGVTIDAMNTLNACLPLESGIQAYTQGKISFDFTAVELLATMAKQYQIAQCWLYSKILEAGQGNFVIPQNYFDPITFLVYDLGMRRVDFPNLAASEVYLVFQPTITGQTYEGNPNLRLINFPELLTLYRTYPDRGGIEIYRNRALEEFYAPKLTDIGRLNIQNCSLLHIVQIQALARVRNDIFITLCPIAQLSLPALISVREHFYFAYNGLLQFADAPLLETIGFDLKFHNCDILTSLTFPALELVGTDIICNQCPNLEVFTVGPDFRIENIHSVGLLARVDFQGCALNQQSVNDLLVKLAAQTPTLTTYTIDLSGGSNAAPSGAAIAAKATLISNGCTVLTN